MVTQYGDHYIAVNESRQAPQQTSHVAAGQVLP